MADVLHSLPSDDAPMSEWLKPLSATCTTRLTNWFSGPGCDARAAQNFAAHNLSRRLDRRKLPPKKRGMTKEEIFEMRALRLEGWSMRAIASRFECDGMTVLKYVKDLNAEHKIDCRRRA